MAASSIVQANERGEKAEAFYLEDVAGLISKLRGFFPSVGKVRDQLDGDAETLLKAVTEFWRENIALT
jgi:hypothetical protein